jgi:hypothetical protein
LGRRFSPLKGRTRRHWARCRKRMPRNGGLSSRNSGSSRNDVAGTIAYSVWQSEVRKGSFSTVASRGRARPVCFRKRKDSTSTSSPAPCPASHGTISTSFAAAIKAKPREAETAAALLAARRHDEAKWVGRSPHCPSMGQSAADGERRSCRHSNRTEAGGSVRGSECMHFRPRSRRSRCRTASMAAAGSSMLLAAAQAARNSSAVSRLQ